MGRFPIVWTRAIRNRSGSAAVEYAVILAMIVLVVTAPLMLMGRSVSKSFHGVEGALVASSSPPAVHPAVAGNPAPATADALSGQPSPPNGTAPSAGGVTAASALPPLSLPAAIRDYRVDVAFDFLPELSLFLLNVLLVIPPYLSVGRAIRRRRSASKEFIDLACALISDALCLTSPHLKVKIEGDNTIREMMKGMEGLGQKPLPSASVSERDLGLQVGYVILAVYGKQPSEVEIPETLIYEGLGASKDYQARLRGGIRKLRRSDDPRKERYNLAFNLVVDLWFKAFLRKELIVSLPARGTYRRDRSKNLQLFTYCAPDTGGHVIRRERSVLSSG
jgi:Flp pilus assembly pilin Flp